MTAPAPDVHRRRPQHMLSDGRLTLLSVRCPANSTVPCEVVGRVRGQSPRGPVYAVDLLDGQWSCTCPAGNDADRAHQDATCSHAVAAQLVTGHWVGP